MLLHLQHLGILGLSEGVHHDSFEAASLLKNFPVHSSGNGLNAPPPRLCAFMLLCAYFSFICHMVLKLSVCFSTLLNCELFGNRDGRDGWSYLNDSNTVYNQLSGGVLLNSGEAVTGGKWNYYACFLDSRNDQKRMQIWYSLWYAFLASNTRKAWRWLFSLIFPCYLAFFLIKRKNVILFILSP